MDGVSGHGFHPPWFGWENPNFETEAVEFHKMLSHAERPLDIQEHEDDFDAEKMEINGPGHWVEMT